jgi:hypothetical protein
MTFQDGFERLGRCGTGRARHCPRNEEDTFCNWILSTQMQHPRFRPDSRIFFHGNWLRSPWTNHSSLPVAIQKRCGETRCGKTRKCRDGHIVIYHSENHQFSVETHLSNRWQGRTVSWSLGLVALPGKAILRARNVHVVQNKHWSGLDMIGLIGLISNMEVSNPWYLQLSSIYPLVN